MLDILKQLFTGPSFGPFNDIAVKILRVVIALTWAAMIAYAAWKFTIGLGKLAAARKTHRSDDISEEMHGLAFPALSLVLLAIVLPILVAIATLT